MKATLVLADGTIFRGISMGAEGEKVGEVVFNTAITGYQEILTDPSYRGQIVTMTYPHIGNTGVNFEDNESVRPFLAGFIVKEYCPHPSNWRKDQDLELFLKKHGIIGIQGIDTRKLTRNLRETGAKKGIISTADHDQASLLKKVREFPDIEGLDLVREVTCSEPYDWDEATWRWNAPAEKPDPEFTVAVYDFGIKQNILRLLVDAGARVKVFPATATSEEVLAINPDGIFLSNGPEILRPRRTQSKTCANCSARSRSRYLLGPSDTRPRCGRKDIQTHVRSPRCESSGAADRDRPCEITSQNHNFAVDPDSVKSECDITHINLNDQTVEAWSTRNIRCSRYSTTRSHPRARMTHAICSTDSSG